MNGAGWTMRSQCFSKVSSRLKFWGRTHEIQTRPRNWPNIVLFAVKPANAEQRSAICRRKGHLNTSICIDEGESCVFKIRLRSTEALRTQKNPRVG